MMFCYSVSMRRWCAFHPYFQVSAMPVAPFQLVLGHAYEGLDQALDISSTDLTREM